MSKTVPLSHTLFRSRGLRYTFVFLVASLAVISAGVFVVDVGATNPDPVDFDETITFGLTMADRLALDEQGYTVPRVQVFYTQYEFVVGFRGVESAISSFQQSEHDRQFGVPHTVYVEAFASSTVQVTDDGFIRTDSEPDWVEANRATFVVGSEARTPAGATAVPFENETVARSFADEYGGELRSWDALQTYSFDIDGPAVVRDSVADRRAMANERVDTARELTARPTSVVVGEDAPTIQAALNVAAPETTVVIPEGTYRETLRIEKPVTLRGKNATIRGDRNGSVVHAASDDVAIVGVHIDNIGERQRPANMSLDDGEGWDSRVDAAYGHADAGIVAANVSRIYIANVSISTPTSGILFRDVTGGVVDGVAVEGPDNWEDGFMSVNVIRSPVVVQHSTFEGNRDGVYLHRAHETVVRNNTFRDNRFGVHLMYTSDSLIADNLARGQDSAGITIMTSPTRNAVVGNDVRDAAVGILPSGTYSYVAENVLVFNDVGFSTGTGQSLYEHNVVYGNDIGARTGSARPSNRIVRNDFVANEQHASAGVGPLRIWTHDGVGNYWEGARADPVDASVDQSYSPTSNLDGQRHRVSGVVTLSESPARTALDVLRDSVPGMRDGAIVDTAPLSAPVNPELVYELESRENSP